MFEGFEQVTIDTGEAVIHARHGGAGSPVLPLTTGLSAKIWQKITLLDRAFARTQAGQPLELAVAPAKANT